MPELVLTSPEPVELTEENLLGVTVYCQDDEIGHVVHLHDLGYDVEVGVECGHLFGLDTKTVALPASEMDFMRDDKGNVFATIERTKDEIETFPDRF